jgi:MFS family permease
VFNNRTRTSAIRKPESPSVYLLLLPLFLIAHFSHHIVAALLTPLLPFIRESFTFNYTRAGILTSAFNLAYGIGQLPGGLLADRLGSGKLIFTGISGVALCGVMVGLSPSFLLMVVFLVMMGVAGGGYHPAASPLVSAAVITKHRGRALGIHQIGGTASYFLAPLITVGIASVLGWRGSFITMSIPTLLYGIVFYLLLGRWGYLKEVEKEKFSQEATGEIPIPTPHMLLPVIMLNVSVQIFVFSTLSFIPLYVVDRYGGSKESAAALLSIAHSAGLWAGPMGGYLSDRMGKLPILLVMGCAAGPAIYLLNHAGLGWSISVLLLFIGMSQYMTMPVAEAYIITNCPKEKRSTILGIYYLTSRGGPGLIAPALGYLIDRYSFSTAFTGAGGAMSVVALVCVLSIALLQSPGSESV